MRLSEAIRLGAMMRPQGRGAWMDGDARCALTGASDAAGIAPEWCRTYRRFGINYPAMSDRFPILDTRQVSPISATGCRLDIIIGCLNDHHGWTRGRIADWVETLEVQQEPAAVDPVGEVAERDLPTRVSI